MVATFGVKTWQAMLLVDASMMAVVAAVVDGGGGYGVIGEHVLLLPINKQGNETLEHTDRKSVV